MAKRLKFVFCIFTFCLADPFASPNLNQNTFVRNVIPRALAQTPPNTKPTRPTRPPKPPKPARPPRPPKPKPPERPARPARPPRPAKPVNHWLTGEQQKQLLDSSLNAPSASALLFWCESTCTPFATLWIDRGTPSSTPDPSQPMIENVQRLPNRKIPKPRPMAGDPRLNMIPATQISPESWLAFTGKPHPEPGDGVLFAGVPGASNGFGSSNSGANTNAGAGFNPNNAFANSAPQNNFSSANAGSSGSSNAAGDVSQIQNSSPKTNLKSVWSYLLQARLSAFKRTTAGDAYFQKGFDQLFVLNPSGKVCAERWSLAKWSLCADQSFTLFGKDSSFETIHTFDVKRSVRYEPLGNYGFSFGAGYYSKTYSAPTSDPLNTQSTAKGFVASFEVVMPNQAEWFNPGFLFSYYDSLAGFDANKLRGESLGQKGFHIEALSRIASTQTWNSGKYNMAFRLYARLFYTQWSEKMYGTPANSNFPSATIFSSKNLGSGVMLSLEEITW